MMNAHGLATELSGLEDQWIEVSAAGGASINSVLHGIAVATFVQLMIAWGAMWVLFTNIFEANRTSPGSLKCPILSVYLK
jgi:hypothetical protein